MGGIGRSRGLPWNMGQAGSPSRCVGDGVHADVQRLLLSSRDAGLFTSAAVSVCHLLQERIKEHWATHRMSLRYTVEEGRGDRFVGSFDE